MIFQKPPIALDFGSSSIKLTEFTGKGKKTKLTSLGLELLPEGLINNGEIIDAKELKRCVKKLINDLDIPTKGRRVSLALSGSAVLLKRMTLVPDSDGELELGDQVYEEAKQQFHHDMNDMYFRFQKLKSKFTKDDEISVIAAAGRIDIIEQYVELIRSIGLKVGVIDTDTFCISNSFEFSYPIPEALIAVANIGANSTQVVLTYEGEYLFSREFYIGGNQITKQIAQNLGIDFENAESLKISASSGDQDLAEKIRPAVQEINEQINGEIKQTIDFFVQHEDISSLSAAKYAFLVGGSAMSLDLASNLSSLIQAPVQIANPFSRIDTSPSGIETEYLLSHGALYGVSAGLALRRMDD